PHPLAPLPLHHALPISSAARPRECSPRQQESRLAPWCFATRARFLASDSAATAHVHLRKVPGRAWNFPKMHVSGCCTIAGQETRSEEHTSELQSRGHLV